jgi:hypothetical protein
LAAHVWVAPDLQEFFRDDRGRLLQSRLRDCGRHALKQFVAIGAALPKGELSDLASRFNPNLKS